MRVWVVETEEESVELSVCGCACMCVGVRGGPFVSLCVSACVCLYEWSSLKCCRMSSKLITSILSSPIVPTDELSSAHFISTDSSKEG